MNEIFDKIQDKFAAPMGRLSQLRIVRAVMSAGMTSIPFTIVGSMFLVLTILPDTLPFLKNVFENTVFRVSDLYMVANTATIGILTLYFCLVIGYELTKMEAQENKTNVDPLNGALISMFALFMCIPELVFSNGRMSLINSITDSETIINGFNMGGTISRLGASGIFTAILVSWLATKIYFICVRKNLVIKMPDSVPPGVARSFTALIPVVLIAFVIIIINGGLVAFGTDIFKVVAIPFGFVVKLTDSWIGVVIIYFLLHAMWIVGIHGGSIISAVLTPIFLANMQSNIDGANIPFAGEFGNAYVSIGGSGATLGLVIFITFFAKSSQLKILGRASIIPSIFNINEPVIFGMPIVYNPYIAIPFIIAPVVSASIAYFATKWELVKPMIAQIPWPTPGGLGAFIGTGGDWRAVVVAIICVVVSFIIYVPFIKIYDNKLVNDEKLNTQEN